MHCTDVARFCIFRLFYLIFLSPWFFKFILGENVAIFMGKKTVPYWKINSWKTVYIDHASSVNQNHFNPFLYENGGEVMRTQKQHVVRCSTSLADSYIILRYAKYTSSSCETPSLRGFEVEQMYSHRMHVSLCFCRPPGARAFREAITCLSLCLSRSSVSILVQCRCYSRC